MAKSKPKAGPVDVGDAAVTESTDSAQPEVVQASAEPTDPQPVVQADPIAEARAEVEAIDAQIAAIGDPEAERRKLIKAREEAIHARIRGVAELNRAVDDADDALGHETERYTQTLTKLRGLAARRADAAGRLAELEDRQAKLAQFKAARVGAP